MTKKKKILAIVGSTKANSSNFRLIKKIEELTADDFEIIIFKSISKLPHFNQDLDNDNAPKEVIEFRQQISESDGIIICTPEYIFSLPGSLKNAIEWCVSTIIFSEKPVGLITASTSGEKGHEELKLIMKTIGAKFTENSTLLIKGIKGKFNYEGYLTDTLTIDRLKYFIYEFNRQLIYNKC